MFISLIHSHPHKKGYLVVGIGAVFCKESKQRGNLFSPNGGEKAANIASVVVVFLCKVCLRSEDAENA